MEEIDIFDLLESASDFLADPTDSEAADKFSEYKSKLVIRRFLPLEQKETAMLKTLMDINSQDLDSHHFASAMEISLTFNGLLAYVANIDYNTNSVLKDESFYDIFWISGLGDYILDFCEADFKRLERMLTSMISFENIKALLREISDITPESIDRLSESFKRFTVETKPDVLKAMADIVKQNDPFYNKVADAIEEQAVKAAMKRQEEEREEKE